MIVEFFCNLILSIFENILTYNLPSFPEDVWYFLDMWEQIITYGAGIFAYFLPVKTILLAVGLIGEMWYFNFAYHTCMFVIRKLPVLGIS